MRKMKKWVQKYNHFIRQTNWPYSVIVYLGLIDKEVYEGQQKTLAANKRLEGTFLLSLTVADEIICMALAKWNDKYFDVWKIAA